MLRIEHPVPDFDGWKRAFDSDPVGRAQGGVRGYRVRRPVDDERYTMVDLEFDSQEAAEAFLEGLRTLWARVEGVVMTDPRVRVVEAIETR